MENHTLLFEFILYGFSNHLSFQHQLFMLFLLIYLMTLAWNLLILFLILTDLHLHTPMYFFLGNLASLDICCSSVIAPRILFDLLTQSLRISKTACISQMFFFIFFISSEGCLLAMMSCDRYVAICRPLHYMQIMQRKVCTNMAFGVWITGIVYSMAHTLCTLRLHFCGSNVLHSFFCDLPQLLKISCTDTSINNMLIFLLGGLYIFTFFMITFFPYVYIFSTVLRIQAKNKRLKAFSTCTSHLTVVFILYGTTVLNYFFPSTNLREDTPVSVCYTLMSPLLNPLIYSLRNQEIKAALRRTFLNTSRILHVFHTPKHKEVISVRVFMENGARRINIIRK